MNKNEKRERNREKGRRVGRCETKRAESAGENSVKCVGRRKKMRTNVANAFSLPDSVLSVQDSKYLD